MYDDGDSWVMLRHSEAPWFPSVEGSGEVRDVVATHLLTQWEKSEIGEINYSLYNYVLASASGFVSQAVENDILQSPFMLSTLCFICGLWLQCPAASRPLLTSIGVVGWNETAEL